MWSRIKGLRRNEEARQFLMLVILTAVLTTAYELFSTRSISLAFSNLYDRVSSLFYLDTSGWFYFMTFGIVSMSILLVLLAIEKERTQKKLRKMSYNRKMPVEVYEKLKEKQTRYAVKKLKSSELYKKFLEDKQAGRIQDIVLSDNDGNESSGDENEIHYK